MASSYLDKGLETYNTRAYVPGGSSRKKARAIQTKGKLVPVPKKKNPYIKPQRGGGSGATSSPSSPTSGSINLAGSNAQQRALAAKPAVSTDLEVNYESDPTLARIKALGQQNVGNAETEAAALRKQAVIDTGLADVGQEIGLDAATIQAARENPLSVAARLAREQALRTQQLDESLNQQNLFYSGHRGTQLGNLGMDALAEQNQLVRDLRSALGGIDSGVLEARQNAALDEQVAMEEAAQRAHETAQQEAFNNALAAILSGGEASADPYADMYTGDPVYDAYIASLMPDAPRVLTPEEELAMLFGG